MKKILIIQMLMLLVAQGGAIAADALPGGIKLLPGYSMKRENAVDASVWEIERPSGPKIHFEAGPSEGSWADPGKKNIYAWFKEQIINGYKVRVAFIKPGLKTVLEPNVSRGLKPGNILLVTFLLENEKSGYTANFSAKVANSEELAEILLIALTFDPPKGGV
jgi:hypothetical protein